MPRVLSRYFLRQYCGWIGLSFLLAMVVGFFGELAELLRINSHGKNFGFLLMLQMASYKLPNLLMEVMPFIFLLATSGFLLRTDDTHELLMARLSGLSLWRIISPFFLLAIIVALLSVALLSPLAAKYYSHSKQLRFRAENPTLVNYITPRHELWLYQAHENGYQIFHAQRWNPEQNHLIRPSVFLFDTKAQLQSRWDAPEAFWRTTPIARWVLLNPMRIDADGSRHPLPQQSFPLSYDTDKLRQQFPSSRQISFWQLPSLIHTAKTVHLSSASHRVQWHKSLASFLVVWAMIGLAIIFGLQQISTQRLSGRFVLARFATAGGIILGVIAFFLINFLQNLGKADWTPPILSAWLPPIIICLIIGARLWHIDETQS